VSVCVSGTTITKKIMDGFVPNIMGRFIGGREDQVLVSLRSVEGCGSNGQKTLYTRNCLHFILLQTIIPETLNHT